MARETATQIDESAAAWAAKVDRGLSADEQSEFEAWQAGDVRRPGAYARMRAISLHTERAVALGTSYDPDTFVETLPSPLLSRRTLIGGGMAAAAAGFVGIALYEGGYFAKGQRYRTSKGEIRQIALGDGSVVTLNTTTELAVRLSKARRDLHLIEGEALFDVAHDAHRPFFVAAGPTLVRAVGTSFTVRKIGERPVEVLVREGVVELSQPAVSAIAPVRLAANHRAESAPAEEGARGGQPITVASLPVGELHRDLAWRDGRIALEGETLGQAADDFARYSDIRIIVDDPALAREKIAGLYQANDPVGFARAAALSLDARAEVGPNEVRIVR